MVRFENVGMRYGSGPEVLRDVSFSLEPGSSTFLTGLSGAGKTTLLKLIYVAEPPSRGLITLFGTELATARRRDLPALQRLHQGRLIHNAAACGIDDNGPATQPGEFSGCKNGFVCLGQVDGNNVGPGKPVGQRLNGTHRAFRPALLLQQGIMGAHLHAKGRRHAR